MSAHRRASRFALAAALALGACSEPVTSPATDGAQPSAVKFWEAGSSVAWNKTARDLIAARAVSSPISQVRITAYLAVAQFDAILAAEHSGTGGAQASAAGAAAGASLVVLKSFFPLDAALLDQQLLNQRQAPSWPGEQRKDFAAGEAVGRAIGAQVVAFAATDNAGLTAPPPNPGGPGNWTGTNPIRGLYGTRTFALTSGDQFRPAPPPVFGSAEFLAALQEVRDVTAGLTTAQRALAQFWAANGPAYLNGLASDMIVAHHNSEREAARVLALANMASFDAANACFDAKFAYYYIRPTQADPTIPLAVPLPNHPSYPSGHSCLTGAFVTVLADAFPEESNALQALLEEVGMARMYGGLHYRFDLEVGRALGRNVAGQVLDIFGSGHIAVPIN